MAGIERRIRALEEKNGPDELTITVKKIILGPNMEIVKVQEKVVTVGGKA